MEIESRSERFRVPKTSSQEKVLVNDAVPASTRYKNKWAVNIFAEWQRLREVKVPVLDCGGLFKDYDLHKVTAVSVDITGMDADILFHRNIVVNNFEIGPNFIKFEENASKTYHGGLCDIKYVPRVVKHVCHSIEEKHEPCLVEIFRLYVGLVETHAKEVTAFYFKPSKTRFANDKAPVGINSLNKILPDMCDAAGFKRKTAHSLRVTCVSSLFNSGVEEKLAKL